MAMTDEQELKLAQRELKIAESVRSAAIAVLEQTRGKEWTKYVAVRKMKQQARETLEKIRKENINGGWKNPAQCNRVAEMLAAAEGLLRMAQEQKYAATARLQMMDPPPAFEIYDTADKACSEAKENVEKIKTRIDSRK